MALSVKGPFSHLFQQETGRGLGVLVPPCGEASPCGEAANTAPPPADHRFLYKYIPKYLQACGSGPITGNSAFDERGPLSPYWSTRKRRAGFEGSVLLQGDYVALKWVLPLDCISPPYPAPLVYFQAVNGQSVAGTRVVLRLPWRFGEGCMRRRGLVWSFVKMVFLCFCYFFQGLSSGLLAGLWFYKEYVCTL